MFDKTIQTFLDSTDNILKVSKLAGDASSRRYYRVHYEGFTEIICHDPPELETFSMKRNLALWNLFKDKGILVPQFGKVDLARGLAAIEDVGDETLLKRLARSTSSEELMLYKKCIDQMLKIHQIKKVQDNQEECFSLAFDFEKLMFEVRHTIKYFIVDLLKLTSKQKITKEIESEFETICAELSGGEHVLVHRDFHSRNIMMAGNDICIIDYQDARMGLPEYDLVSLLDDCYYRISEDNYNKLKAYYVEQKGIVDVDSFEKRYAQMAIQRTFKAMGSFAYMKVVKNDPRYLLNIGYSFEKLRSFLSTDDRYEKLRALLSRAYYENQ